MPQTILQVDAFTGRAFAGNPAAVCILPQARDAAWMQSVASEMNLAETAFLVKRSDGYDLRWFTPAVEVNLCGHATLASAHVLWEEGHLAPGAQARFHTLSGLLTARRDGAWIELDFPARPETAAPPPDGLAAALGAELKYVGRNSLDYIAELDSEDAVRSLKPDFGVIARLPVRGVIVTARGKEYDFISRFFAPAVGINEDPVTGSAHCCLVPYWAAKLGKAEFVAYQASPRGGVLRLKLAGDRVLLAGQAITVLRGELLA
jgi:predicted PhzF superfamily epimerase YddE/YHI9